MLSLSVNRALAGAGLFSYRRKSGGSPGNLSAAIVLHPQSLHKREASEGDSLILWDTSTEGTHCFPSLHPRADSGWARRPPSKRAPMRQFSTNTLHHDSLGLGDSLSPCWPPTRSQVIPLKAHGSTQNNFMQTLQWL